MFLTMIMIFLLGIALIALEDKISINKSATAIMMSVVLWMVVSLSGIDITDENGFVSHLGDVSETLFFVMGALAIIELMDTHGALRVVTNLIHTKRKRRLLWIISFMTFFFSALLDNIAAAVIMIALLRKFVPHQQERWIFASMVIIAANAGGSFSPIGDVTTILLWTGGNVTPMHQVVSLLVPALISMMVPLMIISRFFKADAVWYERYEVHEENERLPEIRKRSRLLILYIGVGTMILVPFFSEITGLPPFMLVMCGVASLWIYTDFMYKSSQYLDGEKLRLGAILSRIDMPTILFFLGILMSVAALNVSGSLTVVSDFLTEYVGDPLAIAFSIGLASSFVDNVALVAATQGMYPIMESGIYAANSEFWTFLAYCAVNGGSLLIIGSATGVTVMGMEKVSFVYYLKRFSLLALAGYVAGAGVYLLIGYVF